MKITLPNILGGLLGLILILSAFGHVFSPEVSSGFIPDFLPKTVVHIGIGIIELLLGIGIFIPAYQKRALQGIMILMICFLPLHIIDLFRENPVIGSMTAAIIRVPVQLLLIFMAWYAGKKV